MSKELLLLSVLTAILMSFIVSNTDFSIVEASGTIPTIYIRADGTVDPYDAPIQRKGASYVIVSDMASDGDGIVVQKSNIMIDGDGHQIQGKTIGAGIALDNVDNVIVRNLGIQDFFVGIRLNSSSSNVISGNTIEGNNATGCEGVELGWNSNNNTILGNTIKHNGNGIAIISNSGNNEILENEVVSNHDTGISLNHSSNNMINGNRIEDNSYGINIYEVCNGTYISANNITTNAICGIDVESGTHIIYHNHFLNNTQNAKTHSSTSVWDNGVEGNFWSDYSGNDSNWDGIGNAAYVMDENNQDDCPLMGLLHSYIAVGLTPDLAVITYEFKIVTNSTVEDFSYHIMGYQEWVMEIDVSNMTADQTFGFVRICIPHGALDLTDPKAQIDGKDPYYANYTLYDNGTHTWIYLAYEYPANSIIVPEFSSFLILPLFMATTLLAIIVYRKKHRNLKV